MTFNATEFVFFKNFGQKKQHTNLALEHLMLVTTGIQDMEYFLFCFVESVYSLSRSSAQLFKDISGNELHIEDLKTALICGDSCMCLTKLLESLI